MMSKSLYKLGQHAPALAQWPAEQVERVGVCKPRDVQRKRTELVGSRRCTVHAVYDGLERGDRRGIHKQSEQNARLKEIGDATGLLYVQECKFFFKSNAGAE